MTSDERWGVAARASRRLLAAPEWVIRAVAGAPVERDGRRLDRSVQLMTAIGDRLGQTGAPTEVEAARRELHRLAPLGMPVVRHASVVERTIPGPGGPIRVRIYRPSIATGSLAAIVYLHGGGWVVGDLDTHDAVCRVLAVESGCAVVAVHYRLAPEHPYPAAVDDAVAAYRWVHAHAADLDLHRGRVGVMGDSAGGNLAAVLSQRAASLDEGVPLAQCLVYPGVDATMSHPSIRTHGDGPGLTRASIEWFLHHYVGDGDRTDPGVSPLFADDLSGQPPTLVFTAGFDVLRDEGHAYGEKLRAAGVRVRVRCYDDQIHGFFGMGVLPGGMDRIREVCRSMGRLMDAAGRSAG